MVNICQKIVLTSFNSFFHHFQEDAMRAKRRDSTSSEAISYDGSVSPTCSLRSTASGVNLSPLSVHFNIRRSTSGTSGMFTMDSDGDEECEFETKPIPKETVNYTIRRGFKRSNRRGSVESTVSGTLSSLSVNSPLSASIADLPAADDSGDDSLADMSIVAGTSGMLASPEIDSPLNASIISRNPLDTIEEVNSSSSYTPNGSVNGSIATSASKKRKSSTDMTVISEAHKAKRRSTARRESIISLPDCPEDEEINV